MPIEISYRALPLLCAYLGVLTIEFREFNLVCGGGIAGRSFCPMAVDQPTLEEWHIFSLPKMTETSPKWLASASVAYLLAAGT